MAETVTIEEVKSMGVTAPDVIIDGWIDTAAQADTCIDALGMSASQEKALKLYFIAWQLDEAERGTVTSETSPTGASRSYAKSNGASNNRFGKVFLTMPGSSCLMATLTSTYSTFFDVIEVNNG